MVVKYYLTPKPKRLKPKDWRNLLATRRGWKCFYCHRRMSKAGTGHLREVTLDHVVPVALGGENRPENYAAACRICNEAKATLSAEAFLAVLAEFNAEEPA